jgi:hypothetical protein
MLIPDLEFDGQLLTWKDQKYTATSGLPDFQDPKKQCTPDAGPVPEGLYKLLLTDGGQAKDDGKGVCNLRPSWGIQSIPRGVAAGACESYWANWGNNRVRMEPADPKTKSVCAGKRAGFYVHDSTKGYSHGCIEVEKSFFSRLRTNAPTNRQGALLLRVLYVKDRPTYGGTREQK